MPRNANNHAALGTNDRKLQPKLRMYANGDSEVNANRAAQSACVSVTSKKLLPKIAPRPFDDFVMSATTDFQQPVAKPPSLETIPDDVLVNVFVETVDQNDKIEIEDSVEDIAAANPEDASRRETGVTARRGHIATATVRLSQLQGLIDSDVITYVEPGQSLATPTPNISSEMNVTPAVKKFGDPKLHKNGRNILIGIIDVHGFDFTHPDFLKNEKTRFVRIWDQGGDSRANPHERAEDGDKELFDKRFDYGSEIVQDEMNAAIKAAKKVKVPAFELEPQSQMLPCSHGTHVASIAAGNSGVCSEALIAGVLIYLPTEERDPRRSFYDSTRIAHAVDYLFALGQKLGVDAVSINISLGTNGHAHDASSAVSRWIDSALVVPGRSVCVAAGNAGQHAAESPGDLGYVLGRIHTSGQVSARDLVTDIAWEVIGDGRTDVSENELEIWYAPQDQFAVSVKPPGADWIGPVKPLEFIKNRVVKGFQDDFKCVLSIFNELYHPANGSNYIGIYLSPFLKEPKVGIASGTWTVRLHGIEVRDGGYHGWIERDDPRRAGEIIGNSEAWYFPSFFSERSNIDESSVSSLACGQRIVSVANLDEKREKIHITSSQGPTRDKRFKPDVAAPGTDVVAACGFGDESRLWVKMTGTSMASPFVAGIAGLMLAVEKRLTAAQIEAIIHRTSRPLPGANFKWLNDAGFGRIDPEACLREAALVYARKEIKENEN
ncbi:MAG TPA: S8 family serine peptidase [Pyrinomonadaceae bacterium]|jgi:subtilisin family serine protease